MAMGITPFYSYFCSIIRFLLIKFPVFIKAFTFSLGIVYAVDLTASIRSRVWMTHNHGTRIVSERGNLQNRENRRDPLYAAYSVDKHYHLFKWLLNAIITKYADAFFNIPLSISPHFQYPIARINACLSRSNVSPLCSSASIRTAHLPESCPACWNHLRTLIDGIPPNLDP